MIFIFQQRQVKFISSKLFIFENVTYKKTDKSVYVDVFK